MYITDQMVEDAFEVLRDTAEKLPLARAQRQWLDAGSKSIKAKIMAESGAKSSAAAETEAYASEKYQLHQDGLKEAVIAEETLRLKRDNAAITLDTWRTQESTRRSMGRVG